jgi:hypothetical protein
MSTGLKPLCGVAMLALLGLLCACGASKSPGAAGAARSDSRRQPYAQAGNSADQDLVSAVSSGGSGPPLGLKFRLDTRPVVGMPAQLVLALIPSPGIEISHIHGSLQSADGLQLQSADTFDIDAPQGTEPLEQDVTIVPQRNGVLSLNAILVIDYDDVSIARTYVIPLIAANNAS